MLAASKRVLLFLYISGSRSIRDKSIKRQLMAFLLIFGLKFGAFCAIIQQSFEHFRAFGRINEESDKHDWHNMCTPANRRKMGDA